MGTKQQSGVKLGYLVQIRSPNVQALRYLGSGLKGQWRRAFEKMHDNLLQIQEIETQSKALEALVQYYNPPTRCFTFRDFQLAPTLEEYKRLLGLPLAESAQYFHQDQPPSWAVIARLLKVSKEEMTISKRNQNGLEGLPRVYLEQQLHQLQGREDWPTVMDTLGTSCPIEDFKWSWIQPMTKEAWFRKLDEASKRTIRWYPSWNEREHIIVKCEGYPNVPLLGTQGVINYNLELVVQQVGYPMIRPPPEEVMTPFMLYGPKAHKGIHYRSNTIKKGAVGKLWSCGASLGYRRWLEDRVKSVGLPWGKIPPRDSDAHKYEVQKTLEVGKLKATLEQAKAKRANLKRKLERPKRPKWKEKPA
ncbi:hypothetical protein CR513_54989, partial [Mucuna pruriens]